MLKAILDSLDGINPAIAAEYSKGEDGKFYLQADGMILKAKFDGKLDESNKKNSELSKQLQAMQQAAADKVDRAEVARLQGIIDDLENGKGGEKFKKVVEREVAAFKLQAEENIKTAREKETAASKRAEESEKKLKSFTIRQAVQAAASEVGLRGKNAPQYLSLAEQDFDLQGDKVVAVKRSRDASGAEIVTPILGSDYEPLPLKDFIAKSHRSGSYDVFFDGGSGSGAPGAPRANGSTGGQFVLSREQARDTNLYRATKEKAEKAGAEVKIEGP